MQFQKKKNKFVCMLKKILRVKLKEYSVTGDCDRDDNGQTMSYNDTSHSVELDAYVGVDNMLSPSEYQRKPNIRQMISDSDIRKSALHMI